MSEIVLIVLLTLGAGLAMPAGAILAYFERIRPEWLERDIRHGVIAFGGGALLSAISLVLVPQGLAAVQGVTAMACFLGGGVAFLGLDRFLAARRNAAGQLVAMLADFIPEALALGATFAISDPKGKLLAALIAVQNLPEGFNAYRELRAGNTMRPGIIIAAFTGMAFLGPVCGLAGHIWLAGHAATVGGLMLFAAGGILYLIFQDIAPQSHIEKRWVPALGAVLGFGVGMIGEILLGHG